MNLEHPVCILQLLAKLDKMSTVHFSNLRYMLVVQTSIFKISFSWN